MNPVFVHQHGIGDFFHFSKFWSREDIASLREIHWACFAADACISVTKACPAFDHVKHVRIGNPLLTPPGLLEHTSGPWFDRIHGLPFIGSPFLRYSYSLSPWLRSLVPYVVIHGSTPFNSPATQRARNLEARDWEWIASELDRRDLVGIVLNSEGAEPPPDYRRIWDFTGETTLAQSIEILRRAWGYWGIDSCLAILASELFPADRLQIRTRNPWLVREAPYAYAPHREFPFLVPSLGEAPHEPPAPLPDTDPSHVQMRILRGVALGHRMHYPGDVALVAPDRASELASLGWAALA